MSKKAAIALVFISLGIGMGWGSFLAAERLSLVLSVITMLAVGNVLLIIDILRGKRRFPIWQVKQFLYEI